MKGKSGFGIENRASDGKSASISKGPGEVRYGHGSARTTRENTSSGRERTSPYAASEGASKVAEVMLRQGKPQGTAKGMKFDIVSDNLAHHASKKPEPTV
jgi:hypothetical protein